MARDSLTSLVVTPERVAWTRLERQRDAWRSAAVGDERPADASDDDVAADPVPVLKGLGAECGGRVTLGLDSDLLLLRVLDLPKVSTSELEEMISLQADGLAPLPLEAMTVSHEVLAEEDDTLRVLLAMAPLGGVARAGDWLDEAGLRAERIDAVVLGWWWLLRDGGHLQGSGREVVAVAAGAAHDVIVLDDGVPIQFTRIGQALREAELRLTLASAELRFGAKTPSGMLLVSDEAPDAAMLDALSGVCGVVRRIAKAELGQISDGVARRATAAKGIDLVPVSWVARRQKGRFRRRLVVGVAASLLLWLAVVGTLWFGPLWAEAAVVRRQAALDGLATEGDAVRETRNRVRLISEYMDVKHSPMEVFREVVSYMPRPGMLLSSVLYRKDEALHLSGQADTANLVYTFKDLVDASPLFVRSTLNGPKEYKGKQSFELVIELEEVVPR